MDSVAPPRPAVAPPAFVPGRRRIVGEAALHGLPAPERVRR
jgi:hypothetical protein